MKSSYSGAWGKYPQDNSFHTSKDYLPYALHKPRLPTSSNSKVVPGRALSRSGESSSTHPYYTLSEVYKEYPVTRERKCNGYKDLTGGYSQDSIITPQDVKAMGGCSESFSVDPSRISKARGLEFDLPIQSDSCPFGYVKVARTYHSTGITKYTCVREQYPVDKEDEGKLYSDNGVPFKMRLDNGFYAGNEVVEAHLALQKGRTYNDHEFSETGFNHVNPGYSMTNNYLPITSPPPPPRVSQVVSRESALGLGGQTPYIASEADKPCRFSGYSVNPHTNSQIVYYPPARNNRKHQRYTKNPVTSAAHL